MNDYDQEVKAIEEYNRPILDDFEEWLTTAGLSQNTIRTHVNNIDFFTHYLVYYEPLCRLDEADAGDVQLFLLDWYPRKTAWASEAHTRSYMASFRKFFKFMVESERIDGEIETEVRTILKKEKDEFLEAVAFDDDDWW